MDHQHQQQQAQHQHPGHAAPEQEWQSSLFNCMPCGTCLLSSCLPCMLVGRTSARMRDPSMESFEEVNSECLIFSAIHCLTGCGWIYAMMKRGEIRDQFGIKGSDCGDCCTTCCCLCCAMIQADNEVKLRTAGRQPITQGYQSEKQGMHVPGQQQQPMMQPEHQNQPPMYQQQPAQQQPMQHPAA